MEILISEVDIVDVVQTSRSSRREFYIEFKRLHGSSVVSCLLKDVQLRDLVAAINEALGEPATAARRGA